MRKIIVYQKQAVKPIILTDSSNESMNDLKGRILSLFKSENIFTLETENDILCIRPSEVQSILITKQSSNIELSDAESPKKNLT